MFDLLQRQGGFNQPQPAPNPAAAAASGGIMLVFVCVILVFSLVPLVGQIMICLRASRVLTLCKEKNRKMQPGMVWLLFVPIINIVYIFLVPLHVAETLEKEYRYRGLRGDGDFGRTMGLIHAIGLLICGISALITPFLYAGKLNTYVKQLERKSKNRDEEYEEVDEDEEDEEEEVDEDDDEDDRPRRRR